MGDASGDLCWGSQRWPVSVGQTTPSQVLLLQSKDTWRHHQNTGIILQDINNQSESISVFSLCPSWQCFFCYVFLFTFILINSIWKRTLQLYAQIWMLCCAPYYFMSSIRNLLRLRYWNCTVSQKTATRRLTGRRCSNLAERSGTESIRYWWVSNLNLV